MKNILTDKEYEELINLNPYERVREGSIDNLDDKIIGILIAFAKRYDMRNGHIDIITTNHAVEEIKTLMISRETHNIEALYFKPDNNEKLESLE